MKNGIDSHPETTPGMDGRQVSLSRLQPGSIFRWTDSALYTVLDAGNLIMDIVEVKIKDKERILVAHIHTGEVSSLLKNEMVEPQFFQLCPITTSENST